MEILIDGQPAAMKKGTNFDFVSENRYFSGADSYSMAITFPLKDCPQNLAIFGHINRLDVAKNHIIFDCEIRDQMFYKRGSITITSINNLEVKTQFLEGKSVTNYDSSFDSVYLNELTLGYPDTSPSSYDVTNHYGYVGGMNWLALPWVNNNSGNVQNDVNFDREGWNPVTWKATALSFQPYMIYIVKRIFDVLGYTYDLSSWENSKYAHMIICNALPAAWGIKEFAAALPHWTLTNFFEQLEYLLNGEFDINHSLRTVKFSFTKQILATTEDVEITQIVDEFSSEVQKLEDCKYRECKNLKYADCDHYMWKYYICPELIKWIDPKSSSWLKEFNTIYELLHWVDSHELWDVPNGGNIANIKYSRMFHVKDLDRYFIMRRIRFNKTGEFEFNGEMVPSGNYELFLQPINMFEGVEYSPDADTLELKIVPAWIGDTNRVDGQCIFLQLPDYAGESTYKPYNGFANWDEAIANLAPECDYFLHLHEDDESVGNSEYLDMIYVGFYPGAEPDEDGAYGSYDIYVMPFIDSVMTGYGWVDKSEYSLRLQHDDLYEEHHSRQIDPTMKYTFKFLSDTMPDVRSLFFIHGQRYVAEKITVNFTENGMSNLMKMEAWQVVD